MGSEEMVEKRVIKVAALCGSLRKASFNRGLVQAGIISTLDITQIL